MNYNNIQFESEGNIGIITLNRPKAMNALNGETIREIRSLLASVKDDGETRALIITGAGEKAFCAGADLNEVKEVGLKESFDFFRKGHQMNHDIENLGIPVIAAINGLALGGGCELALSCTLRVVSRAAKLGLPELGLGVIPGFGGTQRLTRLAGKSDALWYLLTGDMIDAEKAVDMGIANLIAEPDELMDRVHKLAKKITKKAPLAVKAVLNAVHYGAETDLETGLVLEAAFANVVTASEDKKEGIAAFLEKRDPKYQGC